MPGMGEPSAWRRLAAKNGKFASPMRLQVNGLAEIELVVARHEHVRLDHVGELDDVRALVEARHQRGREGVARMAEQHRHAAAPARPSRSRRAARSRRGPGPTPWVDVVDQEQGEGDIRRRGLRRLCPCHRDRQAGAEPESQGFATGYVCHQGLRRFFVRADLHAEAGRDRQEAALAAPWFQMVQDATNTPCPAAGFFPSAA